MAHEIMEEDKMFSVREKPWHGLGTILEDHPDLNEAIVASGLDWDATIQPMFVNREIMDGNNVITYPVEVPNNFGIVREDTNHVLGVVGNRYQVYQNSEMWKFIEEFQNQSGIKLDTAGSLKNGRTTWVLAKNATISPLKGDPVEEYFLFRNSFDGSSPISVMFTNIRVVCSNTLNMALKGAKNVFNVRHTASAGGQIKEVQLALALRVDYQKRVEEVMTHLTTVKMNSASIENFIGNNIFPLPTKITRNVGANGITHDIGEATQRAKTTRTNKINAVLELVETGAGTDIVGVKGTAWGVYNALTEWADHEKSIKVRKGRNTQEVKFENALFGTGAKFKADSLDELLAVV